MTSAIMHHGVITAGENHLEIFPPAFPSVPKPGVLHVHGASGYAQTALGWLDNNKPHATNVIARNGYTALAADLAGPQTWGNVAANTALTNAYNRLQLLKGVKPGKVFLHAHSMGGLTTLNWARANPTLVQGIFLVVPVIDLNDIVVNNRTGYASLVNAAHGGAYNESTMGATRNPLTQALAGHYKGFPIYIIYGLTDTTCVPEKVVAFKNAVGSNVTISSLASGHDMDTYRAVNNETIVGFFNSNL